MEDKIIPSLESIEEIDANAVFPVDDGAQTYKIGASDLAKNLERFPIEVPPVAPGGLILTRQDAGKFFRLDSSTPGGTAIFLPPASEVNGYAFQFKDVGGAAEDNPYLLHANGEDEIDGVKGVTELKDNYGAWTVVSDGVGWFIAQGELKDPQIDANKTILANMSLRNWTSYENLGERKRLYGITWSAELGLFVAVGTPRSYGNPGIVTSPDGVNWTERVAPWGEWRSVTWSPELGLFVAVATEGEDEVVITSPDGTTWTPRAAVLEAWQSVTWSPELGLFVAVAASGTNRVMTSPDGVAWTPRAGVESIWYDVTWSPELGLFAAVGGDDNSSNPAVMTSPDGVNWTDVSAPAGNWRCITWSPDLGLFVALGGGDGTNPNLTISSDGVVWHDLIIPNIQPFLSTTRFTFLAWVKEFRLFVAIFSDNFGGSRVCSSSDGKNWTGGRMRLSGYVECAAWSPELGLFAAASENPTANTDYIHHSL